MGKMLRIAGMSSRGLWSTGAQRPEHARDRHRGLRRHPAHVSGQRGGRRSPASLPASGPACSSSARETRGAGRRPARRPLREHLTREDVEKVRSLPTVAAASASVPTAALVGTKTIPMTGVDPSYAHALWTSRPGASWSTPVRSSWRPRWRKTS